MIKIIKRETKETSKHYLRDGSYLMNFNFKQGYPGVTINGIDRKDCIILEEGLKIPNGQAFSISDKPEYPHLDTAIEIDGCVYYTNRSSISKKHNDTIIPMSDMKPLQVGVMIDDNQPTYKGDYVMRTASSDSFEIINLSTSRIDSCWTSKDCPLKVRLLNPGEKITIELSN